jgi:integrase
VDYVSSSPVLLYALPGFNSITNNLNSSRSQTFTYEQLNRIAFAGTSATSGYPHKQNAVRLRALVYRLRYSGLRITDAVTLTKHRMQEGVLVLRTAKTGTELRVPLPKTALDALAAMKTDNYYYWSGRGMKKSCVGDYQRAFKKLYELAKVENRHAHRWRDTFAVELLLVGVPARTGEHPIRSRLDESHRKTLFAVGQTAAGPTHRMVLQCAGGA